MINASTYGVNILNALFNTSGTDKAMTVSFPATPYLALYTQMPDNTGAGGKEPTSNKYIRVPLASKGITGLNLLKSAEIVDKTVVVDAETNETENRKAAKIVNQELIFFPEAETEAWGEIVGFGVYSTQDKSNTTPYFWGKLTEPVTVEQREIAIFRIGDFEITFC